MNLIIFDLLVLLLPTQLAYHFWPDSALIFGIRVDYLSPTVNLTDLLVITLFILNFGKLVRFVLNNEKVLIGIIILLIFAAINSYFGINIATSIYRWVKILEVLFLAFYIYSLTPQILPRITRLLNLVVGYVVFLGTLQVLLGRTIGGVWSLLGERTFNMATPGIALFEIGNRHYLRAYSVFSHPNVMGGFLIFCLVILLNSKKVNWTIVGVTVLGIALSFSQAAWICTLIIFGIYLVRINPPLQSKVEVKLVNVLLIISLVGSLITPFVGNMFLDTRRFVLAKAAGVIFSNAPILGVGVGNFILALSKLSGSEYFASGVIWWLQPVHNIFLLVLAETGVVGLIALFLGLVFLNQQIYKISKRNGKYLVGIMFITVFLTLGFFDHYFWTSQQGILIVGMMMGILLSNAKITIYE